MANLHDKSIVRQKSPIATAEISEDVVLFDEAKGQYFGISGTGAEIWRRIETDTKVADLCGDLERIFDVDPEACRRDVLEFLNSMENASLLVVSEAPEDSP